MGVDIVHTSIEGASNIILIVSVALAEIEKTSKFGAECQSSLESKFVPLVDLQQYLRKL